MWYQGAEKHREKAFCSVGWKKRQKAIRLSEPVAKAKPGLADVIYVNVWTPSFWYLIWTWLPIKSKQFLQTNGKGWQLLCNVWRMLLGFSTLPSNFEMEFPINRVELLLLIAEIGAEDIQKWSFCVLSFSTKSQGGGICLPWKQPRRARKMNEKVCKCIGITIEGTEITCLACAKFHICVG